MILVTDYIKPKKISQQCTDINDDVNIETNTYAYYPVGDFKENLLQSVIAPDGSKTTYDYAINSNGRLYGSSTNIYQTASTTDPSYTQTVLSVNNYGQAEIININEVVTSYGFDAYGRCTVVSQDKQLAGSAIADRSLTFYHAVYDLVDNTADINPVPNASGGYVYIVPRIYYTYDGLGRLIEVESKENASNSNSETRYIGYYYEFGCDRLTSVQQYDGSFSHIIYDHLSRPYIRISNHHDQFDESLKYGAAAEMYTYNLNNEVVNIWRKYGGSGVELYDGSGYLEQSIIRDWAGRPAIVDDHVGGRWSETSWNSFGNITNSKVFGYDNDSSIIKLSDQTNNYISGIISNGVKNNITGIETTVSVNNIANTASQEVKNSSGSILGSSTTNYDHLGRKIFSAVAGKAGSNTQFTAFATDNWGNTTGVWSGNNESTVLNNKSAGTNALVNAQYNNYGMLTGMATPLGGSYTIAQAPSGSGVHVTDPEGNSSTSIQNGYYEITNKVENDDVSGNDRQTNSANDVFARKSSISREDQTTNTYYDAAGRQAESEVVNDGKTVSSEYYFYNKLGMIEQVIREDGSSLIYDYYRRSNANPCNRDRLHAICDDDSLLRLYENYNIFGKPEIIKEYNKYYYGWYVQTEHTYEKNSISWNFGKLVSETTTIFDNSGNVQAGPFLVSYSYDELGRRSTLDTINGIGLDYFYTDNHQLDSIWDVNRGTIAEYTYGATGLDYQYLTRIDYLGGSYISYDYDDDNLKAEAGLVSSMTYGNGIDPEMPIVSFGYDSRGLKDATKQWNEAARTYQYDGFGRLSGAGPGTGDKFGNESFDLDNFENRSGSVTLDGQTVTYNMSSSKPNRYASIIVPDVLSALTGSQTLGSNKFHAKVDFMPEDATAIENSIADIGSEWSYQNGRWYGWANAANNKARANIFASSDGTDTWNKFTRGPVDDAVNYLWHIDVPHNDGETGYYNVKVRIGFNEIDQVNPRTCSIWVEGQELSGTVPAGSRWTDEIDCYDIQGLDEGIEVSDGLLTVSGSELIDNESSVIVDYIEIEEERLGSLVIPRMHDSRGNFTSDDHFTYYWDSFDRLIHVYDSVDVIGDGTPPYVDYLYDGFGRRVAKIAADDDPANPLTSSVFIATVYDDVAPIEERLFDSTPLSRYYYGRGLTDLVLVDKYSKNDQDETVINSYVPIRDDRGTIVGVADSDGNIIEKLYYNSTGLCKSYYLNTGDGLYHENLRADGTGYNLARSEFIPFGWCGMYRDQFTGMYHTHFREYDPLHGRWLSEDPAGYADGLNLYNAYMSVNGVDPLGLDTHDDFENYWKGKPYVPDDKEIKRLSDLLTFKEGALVFQMYIENGSMAIQTYSRHGREIADELDKASYNKELEEIRIGFHGLTAGNYRDFFNEVKKLSWYKESLQQTTVRALDYTIQATLFLATGGEAQVAELLGMSSIKVFPALARSSALKYGFIEFSDDFGRLGINYTDDWVRFSSSSIDDLSSAGFKGSTPNWTNLPPVNSRSNSDLIQEICTRADIWGNRKGFVKGSVAGKRKHKYAENFLDRYQNMYGHRGLHTEERYLNGNIWKSGQSLKDTVILDVVEGPLSCPTNVWDYKFGNATLSQSRINQIRLKAGLGPQIPIIEVKP